MTETVDETPAGPVISAVRCRNCGAKNKVDLAADPVWLCPKCEHYQDQTNCPVCGQTVRIEFLPTEYQPADKSKENAS